MYFIPVFWILYDRRKELLAEAKIRYSLLILSLLILTPIIALTLYSILLFWLLLLYLMFKLK